MVMLECGLNGLSLRSFPVCPVDLDFQLIVFEVYLLSLKTVDVSSPQK